MDNAKLKRGSALVYSTEGGRLCPHCSKPIAACNCKSPQVGLAKSSVVRVMRETKGRGGKSVSVIHGLGLAPAELEKLCTQLKKRCGTGGTSKEGTIEIQGEHRDTLVAELLKLGYAAKKRAADAAMRINPMRINKYISETGVCSRREADGWIEAGRVSINGQLATLGSKVEAGDVVHVDGKPIGAKKPHIYIALNKPMGITCTSEPHIKDNIVDFVGHTERIFPIGRLDKESEGLILLTNNGDIVNEILRVENAHEKEYVVTVDRPLTEVFLKSMASGVRILGTLTKPCICTRIDATCFRIVLTQGLNRQIRRMCARFDYKVRRLQRVRIMHIELGSLKKARGEI